jgi:hypothetical protein
MCEAVCDREHWHRSSAGAAAAGPQGSSSGTPSASTSAPLQGSRFFSIFERGGDQKKAVKKGQKTKVQTKGGYTDNDEHKQKRPRR